MVVGVILKKYISTGTILQNYIKLLSNYMNRKVTRLGISSLNKTLQKNKTNRWWAYSRRTRYRTYQKIRKIRKVRFKKFQKRTNYNFLKHNTLIKQTKYFKYIRRKVLYTRRAFFFMLKREMRPYKRRLYFKLQLKYLHSDFHQTSIHADSKIVLKSLTGLKEQTIKYNKYAAQKTTTSTVTPANIFSRNNLYTYSTPQIILFTLLNPFLLKLLTNILVFPQMTSIFNGQIYTTTKLTRS